MNGPASSSILHSSLIGMFSSGNLFEHAPEGLGVMIRNLSATVW